MSSWMWFLTRCTGIVAACAGGGVAGVGPVLLRSQHRHPAEGELVAGAAQLPGWPHARVRRPAHAGVVPRHRRGGWRFVDLLVAQRRGGLGRSGGASWRSGCSSIVVLPSVARIRRRLPRTALARRAPAGQSPPWCSAGCTPTRPAATRCRCGSPAASRVLVRHRASIPVTIRLLGHGCSAAERHSEARRRRDSGKQASWIHPSHSPEPRPIDPLLQQRAQHTGGRRAGSPLPPPSPPSQGPTAQRPAAQPGTDSAARIAALAAAGGSGQASSPAKTGRRAKPARSAKLVRAGAECGHRPSGWPGCSRSQDGDNVDSIELTDRHLRPTR
jgi:hypothetical protein